MTPDEAREIVALIRDRKRHEATTAQERADRPRRPRSLRAVDALTATSLNEEVAALEIAALGEKCK